MATFELIKSFLQQATAQGSRSTALNPLGWLVATLIAGVISCVWVQAPSWITGAVAILVCVSTLIFMIAYIYFALTNVDALRSEKYTLSKMAIEKSLIGDNLAGTFESTDRRVVTVDQPRPAIGEAQDE